MFNFHFHHVSLYPLFCRGQVHSCLLLLELSTINQINVSKRHLLTPSTFSFRNPKLKQPRKLLQVAMGALNCCGGLTKDSCTVEKLSTEICVDMPCNVI